VKHQDSELRTLSRVICEI